MVFGLFRVETLRPINSESISRERACVLLDSATRSSIPKCVVHFSTIRVSIIPGARCASCFHSPAPPIRTSSNSYRGPNRRSKLVVNAQYIPHMPYRS